MTKEVFGHTVTKLQVTESFSDSVKTDDILTITEEYYFIDENNVHRIFQYDEYAPSNVGQEYIFFLNEYKGKAYESFKGKYYPTDGKRGKYAIVEGLSTMKGSSITNELLNVSGEVSANYLNIMKDVLEKYN